MENKEQHMYLPRIEAGTLVCQAMSLGTHMELLDLLDYAKENDLDSIPVRHIQEEVIELQKLDEETKDAEGKFRMFTEYNIFMDEKAIRNSLDFALWENSEADANNVSANERAVIEAKLRTAYMSAHRQYKEPDPHFAMILIRKFSTKNQDPVQLELFK